jgi:hypothetical protein
MNEEEQYFHDLEEEISKEFVNIHNDPIDERFNLLMRERLEFLLKEMKQEKTLCDFMSNAIIVEFGLKGNRAQVIEKFEKIVNFSKNNPYIEDDRAILIYQNNKFRDYIKTNSMNPFRIEIRKLSSYLFSVKGKERDDLDERIKTLRKRMWDNASDVHKKRECCCYFND